MYFSGTHGELYIDGVKAAKVRNWTFSSSLGLLDTTTLGDTDSTSTPGIRTNTGSCQLFYYSTTGIPSQNNSASTLINKLLKAGTDGVAAEAQEVVLKLAVTDSGGATSHIQGPAYLTSVSMSCSVGEVLSADVSFQINGAFTEVVM